MGTKLLLVKLVGLGYSEGKARKIMRSLAGKNVMTYYRGVGTLKVQFPNEPRLLKSISEVHKLTSIADKTVSKTSEPTKEASTIVKALESYWEQASVNKIKTIYYPYFINLLIAEDGSKRIEALDAVTGIINEDLGKRIVP